MSVTIEQHFVEQFSANIHLLAEQRMSRLRGTVNTISVTGESFAVERLGGTEVQEVTERHGDTPLNETEHSRRWGFIRDFDVADLIDKQDKVKILADPEGAYTRPGS